MACVVGKGLVQNLAYRSVRCCSFAHVAHRMKNRAPDVGPLSDTRRNSKLDTTMEDQNALQVVMVSFSPVMPVVGTWRVIPA